MVQKVTFLGVFRPKIIAFVAIEVSYLRFSCHFRPRPEIATLLLATVLKGVGWNAFGMRNETLEESLLAGSTFQWREYRIVLIIVEKCFL